MRFSYEGKQNICPHYLISITDSGSSANLISESLVSRWRAPKEFGPITLQQVTTQDVLHHKVTLQLTSLHSDEGEPFSLECYVTPKLPLVTPPPDRNRILALPQVQKHQPLADPNLGGSVDILVRYNEFASALKDQIAHSEDGKVLILGSKFGYLIGGSSPGEKPSNLVLPVTLPISSGDRLDELLVRLWEMEKTPSTDFHLSAADQCAVDHFRDTHQVLSNGRFSVSLRRKEHYSTLGESKSTAVRRYLANEKSLTRKGQLGPFMEVLNEYLLLDHAELVPTSEIIRPHSTVYYLPVHGVAKETSTTTKLGAVFDGSAKSSSGSSLNDQLLSGPNLYPLLSSVLLRFRTHRVAFASDISKMFREIMLNPEERDLHRFLVRDDSGQLQDCRMLRLTFGIKSSPFLATQVLRQVAATNKREQFPQASRIIEQDFYVDDCLSGASTVEEAIQFKNQLLELLSSAGMLLRKWRSNSCEFLQSVEPDLFEMSDLTITDPLSSSKALGIHWHVATDCLFVSVPEFQSDETPTKRKIASSAARVFDVLGLFAPAVLPVKLMLQRLWQNKCEWDQPVPNAMAKEWKEWAFQVKQISKYPVSRQYYKTSSSVQSLQLHEFADASKEVYGAAIYVRVFYEDSTVSTTLVLAKARVAPLKEQTIPRLELYGAHLLSRLLTVAAKNLNISMENVFAWVDSLITLSWIRKDPVQLKIFVANRINVI